MMMDLRIGCEGGLDNVPDVAYQGTSKLKTHDSDEEWRGGKERGNKNATTGATNN
jgi:hypothetical protein